MRRGKGNRDRGFTLVEVTVAMGVLAVILLGLAAVAGVSAQGGYLSKQRIRATYLATQMLEDICNGNITEAMLLAYNGDDTSQNETYSTDTGSRTGAWGASIRSQLQNSAYGTIVVVPIDTDANPITDKYRVTVRVVWFTRGSQHQVNIVGVR